MKLLKIKDACEKVGLSRTKLWEMCRNGEFPAMVKITEKRKGFLESEIDAWIAERVADRDGAAA